MGSQSEEDAGPFPFLEENPLASNSRSPALRPCAALERLHHKRMCQKRGQLIYYLCSCQTGFPSQTAECSPQAIEILLNFVSQIIGQKLRIEKMLMPNPFQ